MIVSKRRVTPGIADELFERGAVPLTKEEIRCLTLGKLAPEVNHRVIDIGAGSGGLTVECALMLKKGRVWAVERDPDALALIEANCRRFELDNVTVINGEAPEALQGIGQVDRIIVGGSGGRLPAIIETAYHMLVPGGIAVLNCILLETLTGSLRLLAASGFDDIRFIQAAISRSRKLGGGTVLEPINPVFIVSALKGER